MGDAAAELRCEGLERQRQGQEQGHVISKLGCFVRSARSIDESTSSQLGCPWQQPLRPKHRRESVNALVQVHEECKIAGILRAKSCSSLVQRAMYSDTVALGPECTPVLVIQSPNLGARRPPWSNASTATLSLSPSSYPGRNVDLASPFCPQAKVPRKCDNKVVTWRSQALPI